MTDVRLSLISHTNVGKTTLARTLLRRDVGEVRDQAHVTMENESHVLIETDRERLVLWDTPGFGDSARLIRRLRAERQPIGWFLHQVWDRVADRALFSSQRAVHNVQNDADVVLYLVNAAESPEEAGYVRPELEILQWIGRPVLVLLNQIGPAAEAPVERWRAACADFAVVEDVLPLDAFARCWLEEDRLLRRVRAALDGERGEAMARLVEAWNARNRRVFRESCAELAAALRAAAADREEAPRSGGGGARGERGDLAGTLDRLTGALRWKGLDQRRARRALESRLDERTARLMDRLIALHGLAGRSAAPIERTIQAFQVRGGLPLDENSGTLAGAVLGGLASGLAADLLAGGLTLGGGAIAGGILGALGGRAVGFGVRKLSGDRRPAVQWSDEFLDALAGQYLLRYLAVAHHGRGSGDFADRERPERWQDAVTREVRDARSALHAAWERAARGPAGARDEAPPADADDRLEAAIERMLAGVLRAAYPDAPL